MGEPAPWSVRENSAALWALWQLRQHELWKAAARSLLAGCESDKEQETP